MTPSTAAYNIIRQWESCRLRAYKPIPSEKYFTIGYGHCGSDVKKYQLITQQEAEQLLQEDVQRFSGKLSEHCPKLKQYQYDALCSFIHNVGWYGFRYSMTGDLASHCNISRAPEEVARRIILWVRAGGQVLNGLQQRRVFEANYFLGYSRFYLDKTTYTIQEYTNLDFTYEL